MKFLSLIVQKLWPRLELKNKGQNQGHKISDLDTFLSKGRVSVIDEIY